MLTSKSTVFLKFRGSGHRLGADWRLPGHVYSTQELPSSHLAKRGTKESAFNLFFCELSSKILGGS